ERGYRRLCEAASRLAYLRWAAAHPSPPRPALAFRPDWPVAELPAEDLLGFHALECWNGKPFRWSGPAAVLRLPLGPGDREVIFATHHVRAGLASCRITAYCNGRRLPAPVVDTAGGIRLAVPAACNPPGGPAYLV